MLQRDSAVVGTARPPADLTSIIQYYSIELAPMADGRLYVGVTATICEREGELGSMDKGDAGEHVWLDLLQTYLPRRYDATSAHVVDSEGNFSDQIDVVVFDRQYSPFIFNFEGQKIIPSESVYAAFEAKQTLNADLVRYAREKCASVRKLHRTSLPIPHAGGTYDAKPPMPILGGVLTFESDWNPPLGDALQKALSDGDALSRLDIGCVAAHGIFCQVEGKFVLAAEKKPATAFLLELIARLQGLATVPMIDIRAYARWLER